MIRQERISMMPMIQVARRCGRSVKIRRYIVRMASLGGQTERA